ncbi:MAG: L,D-transpeptidase [Lachnospiraceae bacterium]|nr:L,D-transpeptidase [Lachnospiraceae bacterium]
MSQTKKRVAAAAGAFVLALSVSFTAFAKGMGPGFEPEAEEKHGSPDNPVRQETEANPEKTKEEAEETKPEEKIIVYPDGMTPNTTKTGGHVDITPINGAAVWDCAEVTGQPAGKENRYTWLSVRLKDGFEGKISYRTYVNHGAWLPFSSDGTQSGGTEESTWVEAIQMYLAGEIAETYDLYYAVATADRGQLGFAAEGEIAGAMGVGDSIQDLKVVLVPKGTKAPAAVKDRYFNEFSGRIGFGSEGAYCINEDGLPYTGWSDYDGKRYYFDEGKCLRGWHYVGGYKFLFAEDGELIQDVDAELGRQDSYEIWVNKALNCLTVFAKDGDSGYTIPVKAMLTSVGDDTPIGVFSTPEKYRWRLMENDTWTQYATRIKAGEGFLFHSVTYEKTDPNTLITAGYNGLGTVRSAGCVRLTCENAKWIYDNCGIGTKVVIYEDEEIPSPFMKPYVKPIPDDQTFDPTDPNINKNAKKQSATDSGSAKTKP